MLLHPNSAASPRPALTVMLLLPILLQMLLLSIYHSSAAATCPHAKFTVVPGHSACLERSPNAGQPSGVSAADQQNIVSYHNKLRRDTLAADMQTMAWDAELATVAQRWANNCQFAHDGGAKRSIPGKYSVGQNIALGHKTWNDVLDDWAAEIKDFNYGRDSTGVVGHYTQMVWSNSTLIGCGKTFCKNQNTFFYVCNYAPGGNIVPFTNRPYAKASSRPGEKCSATTFKDGLCDCKGKTCYNGGVLDLQTCSCKCPAERFVQPQCGLKCSATADETYCKSRPSSDCTRFYNVPYQCPNKCGLCPLAGI